MTVLIPLIVAVALGLVFFVYKHPETYRVMFMFVFPVLMMGALFFATIKIGDLNSSIKSIYPELQRKGAVSDQLADQIETLYQVRQSLKLLLIYYFFGFAYLVFLLLLRDILDLAKDRHHTPT